jgi:hypothetical protein
VKRTILQFLTITIVFLGLWMFPTQQTYASTNCPGLQIETNGRIVSNQFNIPSGATITFKFVDPLANYSRDPAKGRFSFQLGLRAAQPGTYDSASNSVSANLDLNRYQSDLGQTQNLKFMYCTGSCIMAEELCKDTFVISKTYSSTCNITITPAGPSIKDTTIGVDVASLSTEDLELFYNGPTIGSTYVGLIDSASKHFSVDNHGLGSYDLWVTKKSDTRFGTRLCQRQFTVTTEGGTAPPDSQSTDLCTFVSDSTKKSECMKCISPTDPNASSGMWTAIGCIPTTLDGFLKTILPFGMGIGGGIAFLLMLFGALQIMTSAGNPEKLNAGKELVTSAIVGLLLIIFSIFLLRLIGADILSIPGFKGS